MITQTVVRHKKNKMTVGRFMSNWGAIMATVVACIVFSIMEPSFFLTWSNAQTILRGISITTVIAMGATFAFSAGVFDLSIGSTATLGAAFSLTFMVWYGIPMVFSIILTILACCLVGMLNSILVLKFKISAVLTTLAVMFILQGFALTYSGGSVINPTRTGGNGQEIVMKVPDVFWQLGKSWYLIVVMIVCVAVVTIFQNYTKHGRYLYMVGANSEASKLSGVNVNKYRAMAFILTSVFASIGGILIVARAGTVQASAGSSFLMPAIAAVNIGITVGGVGKPHALGTLVGALLMGVVENGLIILSVSYNAIDIAKGIILLLALVTTNISEKK